MVDDFHIIQLSETDSTQTYVKNNPGLFRQNFQTVVCSQQTRGRGRGQNNWQMQPGLDLAFSTVFFIEEPRVERVVPLTVVCGIAVFKALAGLATGLHLKWPNDIYHGSAKVAGVLCEFVGNQLILGVGINVNSTEFSKEQGYNATSLKLITGSFHELKTLLLSTLRRLRQELLEYQYPLGDEVRQFFWQNSRLRNATVTDDRGHSLQVLGLNEDGSLQVQYAEGRPVPLYTGIMVKNFNH